MVYCINRTKYPIYQTFCAIYTAGYPRNGAMNRLRLSSKTVYYLNGETRSRKSKRTEGCPSVLCLCLCELLLYLVDPALLYLLGRVPALGLHLRVDLVLQPKRCVERGVERLVDVRARGFDRAVHEQLACSLFEHEHIFHQISVIHRAHPLTASP